VISSVIAIILVVLLVARDYVARRRERRLLEELETLRAQARQNDRLVNVGHLVSGLAQDLKSPLQGALGSAELLASDPSGADSAQELREIRDHVTRAVGIVRNLLAFTETTELDRRWHDLNQIVGEAVQRHRSSGAAADGMAFQGTGRLQLIYVDGRQIEKVLTTLLNLTVRGSRRTAAGDVSVTARRVPAPEDHMVIDIDDPAVTAAADDEPAWSGDLDACRRILQAHGGSLEVEHHGVSGLRFHLELPITELVENPAT
jgi:two-component system sensor kinase FixL